MNGGRQAIILLFQLSTFLFRKHVSSGGGTKSVEFLIVVHALMKEALSSRIGW